MERGPYRPGPRSLTFVRKALLLGSLLLLVAGCRKDYPEDIPGWVKDRIRDCRKPFHDCNGLEILEYQGLSQRWFYFVERDNGSDALYDEVATLICSGEGMFIEEEQCPEVSLDSLHVVRSVWREK